MDSRFRKIIIGCVVTFGWALLCACLAAEPRVTLVSPTPGGSAAGKIAEVSIGYDTGSNERVTRVEMLIDNAPSASKVVQPARSKGVSSFILDPAQLPYGAHRITVKAYVGSKLIGSVSTATSISSTDSTRDKKAADIALGDLRSGSIVSGIKTLSLNVKPGPGANPLVTVFIDKKMRLIRNVPPYSFDWNTSELPDGKHTIDIVTSDEAGNDRKSSIEVIVRNQGAANIAASPAPQAQTNNAPVRTAVSGAAQVLSKGIIRTVAPGAMISPPAVPVVSRPRAAAATGRSPIISVLPPPAYAPMGPPTDAIPAPRKPIERSVGVSSDKKPSGVVRVVAAAPTSSSANERSVGVSSDKKPSSVIRVVAAAPASSSAKAGAATVSESPAPSKTAPVREYRALLPRVAQLDASTPSLLPVSGADKVIDVDSRVIVPSTPQQGRPVRVIAILPKQGGKTGAHSPTVKAAPADELVPIRQVLEQAGMTVSWASEGKMITASGGGRTIELQVGAVEALVDGRIIVLRTPVKVQNGRAVVPASFIKSVCPAEGAQSGRTAFRRLQYIRRISDS